MKKFKEKEFLTLVNKMFKSIEHTTGNAQVKYQLAQVCIDNDFDYKDVIKYIYNLWSKSYSNFTSRFENLNWENVFKSYIKEAENMYDWSLAKQLSDIVESVSSKGTQRNSDLRNHFFNFINEQGFDEDILRMDMTLDLWGWMKTIDSLLSKAEDVSKEEVSVSPKEEVSPGAQAIEAKMKKTRKKHNYIEIHQMSLDGSIINKFKTIGEAAKATNIKYPSISKCISGTYKKAGEYIWKGIVSDALETAA